MVEDEWQLFHERMDNPARFLKNEGKEALVFWQTKNVSTKVIELLIVSRHSGSFIHRRESYWSFESWWLLPNRFGVYGLKIFDS